MEQQQQTDFLISYAIDEMTEFLIMDYKLELPEALQFIYNSVTYEKLQQTANALYAQSPSYIYEFLEKEYRMGI